MKCIRVWVAFYGCRSSFVVFVVCRHLRQRLAGKYFDNREWLNQFKNKNAKYLKAPSGFDDFLS